MEIDIKLKHVVSSQLLDQPLVLLYLVLDPFDLRPSSLVQSDPELPNLVNQDLMRCMR